MSCDHGLANEWARCSGRNASYITMYIVVVGPRGGETKIALDDGKGLCAEIRK